MQVNRIQSNNYNNMPNFRAVRISDDVRKFPELMEAIVDSPAIKDFIKKNEANRLNTIIDIRYNVFDYMSGSRLNCFRVANNAYKSARLINFGFEGTKNVASIIKRIKSMDNEVRLNEKTEQFEKWASSLSKKQ